MKKINYLMAMFIAAVLCVGLVSCKKSNNDDPKPEPESQFLSLDEFAKSTWTGKDGDGNAITLKVESASLAKVTYFKKSVAKNTDPVPVTITINGYTYDFNTGVFSGTGDDNFTYKASLKTKTTISIQIPIGTFDLTR